MENNFETLKEEMDSIERKVEKMDGIEKKVDSIEKKVESWNWRESLGSGVCRC
jgi:tetrahydromethanopterin S-methyltransferase subunit G